MKGSTKKKEEKTKEVFVKTDVFISVTTNANLSYSVGVCRNHSFYNYESGIPTQGDTLFLIIIGSIFGGFAGLICLVGICVCIVRGCMSNSAISPEFVPSGVVPSATPAPSAPEHSSNVSRKYIQYKIL
jgi:hypothetical protein